MKALLRDYLASLRERDELDAIFPDLLSEIGFTILSRPQRGTAQKGVDVAAVGVDEDGKRKLFLFSIKKGDLTRQDWDGSPQALRASLNEMKGSYVLNRVPKRYRDLPVVICAVIGGVMHEQVLEEWTTYTRQNSKKNKLSFHYWTGDHLATLLLHGILREEILPRDLRSSFQKSVAMVDTPDVSFEHFKRLTVLLHKAALVSEKARLRAVRQLNICLWILYVWARDAGNLNAPYRSSEIALLTTWELCKGSIGTGNAQAKKLEQALHQIINLHISILSEFIDQKIAPHAEKKHGLSAAVQSHEPIDVSLAMFDVLGRLALLGIWENWVSRRGNNDVEALAKKVHGRVELGIKLIWNNPTLLLPAIDLQATDIALFMLLWAFDGGVTDGFYQWLDAMTQRLYHTVHTRQGYPVATSDYRDLAYHPRDDSDEYFEQMTAASTFIPLLAVWLHGTGGAAQFEHIAKLVKTKLQHCTLQLWMPDAASEDHLYLDSKTHGLALCELSLSKGGQALLDFIKRSSSDHDATKDLSAVKTNYWPIVLVACRHYGLPIPPYFWMNAFPEAVELEEVSAVSSSTQA
jgi:hypothetical protein